MLEYYVYNIIYNRIYDLQIFNMRAYILLCVGVCDVCGYACIYITVVVQQVLLFIYPLNIVTGTLVLLH